MGKSQETFSKKEREKKRIKKRQEKQMKREERKSSSDGGGLDNMIAYVDEFGNISDTPPDETKKKEEIDASTIEIGIPKAEDREEVSSVKKGRVAFFNHDKGYGFIKDLSADMKYFVHISGCEEPINDHDKVVFELERGPKGLTAVNVKKSTGG